MGIIGALGYTPMDFVLPQARPLHLCFETCASCSAGYSSCSATALLMLHWCSFWLQFLWISAYKITGWK